VSELCIRAGGVDDLDVVIGLLDEAVEWLVARGQTGQWGTVVFSEVEGQPERFRRLIADGDLRVAELDGEPVGVMILGERFDHVPVVERPELYVDLLVTSRRHAGEGIGSRLVQLAVAEARSGGAELLRVDCWAGAPALVGWYERQGFVRSGQFDVRGWIGQIFEMEV
jgi:GNAT superfamily N-acetyltransferase